MDLTEQALNTQTAQADVVADPSLADGADWREDVQPENGGETCQFISFTIGSEEYAVDIISVREIKGWTEVTSLPNQPEYMRGVLNLRGIIVPIFDMRSRFGMGSTDATPTHVVIIVSVGERIVGLLVDAVSDILTVGTEEIRPVPEMDRNHDNRFLSGLVTVADNMVAILALDSLFDSSALSQGEEIAVAHG